MSKLFLQPDPARSSRVPSHGHETSPTILVIDDDRDIAGLVVETAHGMQFACSATSDCHTFLDSTHPNVSLILLDLMMPGINGMDLLHLLAQRGCSANIVLMSGVGAHALELAADQVRALGLSVAGCLRKPFRIRELEALLSQAVMKRPPMRERSFAEQTLQTAQRQSH